MAKILHFAPACNSDIKCVSSFVPKSKKKTINYTNKWYSYCQNNCNDR